jgi:hypothetical protein
MPGEFPRVHTPKLTDSAHWSILASQTAFMR